MADAPQPALRLSLDFDALVANWRMLDAMSGTARAGAAVKADAYGLGAAQVAPHLREAGCRDFFVAHWGEAADLLSLIPAEELAVLHGPLTAADAAWAKAVGVKPVINSLRQARLWLEAGGGICDLMVDTGINRLGLPMSELGDEAIARLEIDTLHSHLAAADENSPQNQLQQQRWTGARGTVTHRRAAIANSAGIALGKDFLGDLTRPGASLYGGVPRSELSGSINQVARPEAAIMQIRNLQPGDAVGYNATFVAVSRMRVGVVSLGYADGYLRCWSGKGVMRSSSGTPLPVLGRVSMDMTVIDLTIAPELAEGDWVSVDYDLPSAAAASGLSQYELLTLLGRRFPR